MSDIMDLIVLKQLNFIASRKSEILWHIFKKGDNVKLIVPTKLKKKHIEYLENVLKAERDK